MSGFFFISSLSLYYSQKKALNNISLEIQPQKVTALIGASGCGKSSFLRCLNRMNDLIDSARMEGQILLDGIDIYGSKQNVVNLRRNVGMVFQKPNPFPQSIFKNVSYGLNLHGMAKNKTHLKELVELSLEKAGLFNEVKDRLNDNALSLSGGQQQRLCIARALAISPSVLLMDEPCSSLDPISTARIEELIDELRQKLTVVIITHNMQQAARVSQSTAFFHLGSLIEMGKTEEFFTCPKKSQTQDYITGRFG